MTKFYRTLLQSGETRTNRARTYEAKAAEVLRLLHPETATTDLSVVLICSTWEECQIDGIGEKTTESESIIG